MDLLKEDLPEGRHVGSGPEKTGMPGHSGTGALRVERPQPLLSGCWLARTRLASGCRRALARGGHRKAAEVNGQLEIGPDAALEKVVQRSVPARCQRFS